MQTLYQDPHFTFRFAENRSIPRFHLEGIPAGRRVSVFQLDPATGERLKRLATGTVGADGWVDLKDSLLMKAGEAFLAVPATPPVIRSETSLDYPAIRSINSLAFTSDAEARLVDALRQDGYVRVSLVAEMAGQVVGHILFSDLPILTTAGTVPALALAPMAVLPEVQKQGIGSALVRQGLEACRQQGHRIVVVLGHRHFYPHFGFSPELARQLQSPYSGESFMALELVPGALAGVSGRVVYPLPFSAF